MRFWRTGAGRAPVRHCRRSNRCNDRAHPHLTTGAVRAHGVLGLVFEDGLTGDVKVLSRMNGPVFEYARTLEGFQAAQLDVESGTVTWPGGADLAPEWIMVGT